VLELKEYIDKQVSFITEAGHEECVLSFRVNPRTAEDADRDT
jgi:hypothetical protein